MRRSPGNVARRNFIGVTLPPFLCAAGALRLELLQGGPTRRPRMIGPHSAARCIDIADTLRRAVVVNDTRRLCSVYVIASSAQSVARARAPTVISCGVLCSPLYPLSFRSARQSFLSLFIALSSPYPFLSAYAAPRQLPRSSELHTDKDVIDLLYTVLFICIPYAISLPQ